MTNPPHPDDTLITVSGVTKKFPGFALGPLNVTLPTGSIMGLVGSNGAGKTTLLRMLLGSVGPDAGTIEVLHQPVTLTTGGARGVGFVSGDDSLPTAVTGKQLARTTAQLDPTFSPDRFAELTEHYQINTKHSMASLNRSARTHLQLALALACDLRLLVLDEPTAGLDPADRDDLLTTLQEFIEPAGRSVLFSTHLTMDVENIADYVTVLHRGKLQAHSTTQEYLDSYRTIAGTSLGALPEPRTLRGLHVTDMGFTALAPTPWCQEHADHLAARGVAVAAPTLDALVASLEHPTRQRETP